MRHQRGGKRVDQVKSERRRFPRCRAWGWLSGWIGEAHKASVVDISLGGVLIEHSYILRPGTISILTLFLCGAKVSVKCRVVRTVVYRYETWPGVERDCIYRTGLELVDVSEASQQQIGGYIRSLQTSTNDNSQR
ncbi:MAG: PilZ domain-containing protein [Candidatus Methylomirabilales bacterium]